MDCSSSAIILGSAFVLLSIAAILLLLYRFVFLRKPTRTIPKGNVIVSPADGKVVSIIRIDSRKKKTDPVIPKGKLGKVNLLTKDTIKKGYVIVIMMTPLNVHYQRSPVAGTVIDTRYKKGSFRNAVKGAGELNALENEKNEIIIRHKKIGKIKVVQVAGFLARRIQWFVRPKQKIDKGEELGLICLGSQVILVIPDKKVMVKEGENVVDGETIIARF